MNGEASRSCTWCARRIRATINIHPVRKDWVHSAVLRTPPKGDTEYSIALGPYPEAGIDICIGGGGATVVDPFVPRHDCTKFMWKYPSMAKKKGRR